MWRSTSEQPVSTPTADSAEQWLRAYNKETSGPLREDFADMQLYLNKTQIKNSTPFWHKIKDFFARKHPQEHESIAIPEDNTQIRAQFEAALRVIADSFNGQIASELEYIRSKPIDSHTLRVLKEAKAVATDNTKEVLTLLIRAIEKAGSHSAL